MRTREKSYHDYGIAEDEISYIKMYCRNADADQRIIIDKALSDISEYIKPYIFISLVENLSYEKICAKKKYLYISKVDFYAYRRKSMKNIKQLMILNGVWRFEENDNN